MGLDDVVDGHGNQDFKGSELTESQFKAIIRGNKLGRVLQTDLPDEIVDYFRKGMIAKQIVSKLGIEETYGVTENVAISAVYNALKGVDSNRISYSGLMEREEYETLALTNAILAHGQVPWASAKEISEIVGKDHLYSGRSEVEMAFDLSQRPEFRKGTLVDATLIADYLNKTVHRGSPVRNPGTVSGALSVYREGLRESGLEIGVKRHVVPWVSAKEISEIVGKDHLYSGRSEVEMAFDLSQLPEFRKGARVDATLIADYLNKTVHRGSPVRNPDTVSVALSDYRRSLRESGLEIRVEQRIPWVSAKEISEIVGKDHLYSGRSEVEMAFDLSQLPEFRKGTRVDATLIADYLNKTVHRGSPVRNPKAVSAVIYMHKRHLRESGLEIRVEQRIPWASAKEISEIVGKDHLYSGMSEVEIAFSLSEQPELLGGTRSDPKLIADYLNKTVHRGSPVRTPNAVSGALSRYRGSLRESGLEIRAEQRIPWVPLKTVKN